MEGVQGLGRRVLAGSPGPHTASWAESLDRLGLQVNRLNVLEVRRALLDEANRLGQLLRWHRPAFQMRAPGADPVSGPAMEELNAKIEGFAVQCDAQIKALNAAGAVLADTARAYGFSEDEIRDSFGAIPRGAQGPAPGGGWAPR